MPRLLILAVTAAALLSTGCKIRITVPEGGEVVSQSGAYNCAAGATCEVEVSDLFFDETFSAEPASGFEFRSWRRRDRGFCGGNAQPCRLFTSGFAGNPILEAFLGGDDVFFLEPVFEASAAGDLGSGPLSACINPALFQANARVVSRTQSPSAFGTVTTDSVQTIDGVGTFAGNVATRLVLETENIGAQQASARSVTYIDFNLANGRLRQFGTEVGVSEPFAATTTQVFTPFRLSRFDLAQGASFNQTYTTVISSTGAPDTTMTTELRTRYLGRETVTMPAGSFETCRIEERYTDTGPMGQSTTGTQTLWFGVGNGLLLKQRSPFSDIETVSATINGAPI